MRLKNTLSPSNIKGIYSHTFEQGLINRLLGLQILQARKRASRRGIPMSHTKATVKLTCMYLMPHAPSTTRANVQ